MSPHDHKKEGSTSDRLEIECSVVEESPSSAHLQQRPCTLPESLPDLSEASMVTEPTIYYKLSRFWSRSAGNILSFDHLLLLATIVVWFLVGVVAIVTTKLLATSWQVPPLLLTTQQMILSSSLLRVLLGVFSHVQPWPSSSHSTVTRSDRAIHNGDYQDDVVDSRESLSSEKRVSGVYFNLDFVLTGFFNSLDILASNSAFYASAASFVETVKASEPITTTIVALVWRIDHLFPQEGCALLVLILGVLMSTYDNAHSENSSSPALTTEEPETSLELSVRTALTVMVANLCFAFRALCQKRYRANTELLQLNDVNLLFRLQQIGAVTLLLPSFIAHGGIILHAVTMSTEVKLRYVTLAFANAACFAVYNGASCYVLSNVSVLHHSGLNCLRRMFVTLSTCLVFGISMSPVGITGIILCFTGFVAFTHARTKRTLPPSPGSKKTTNVGDWPESPTSGPLNLKVESSQV